MTPEPIIFEAPIVTIEWGDNEAPVDPSEWPTYTPKEHESSGEESSDDDDGQFESVDEAL